MANLSAWIAGGELFVAIVVVIFAVLRRKPLVSADALSAMENQLTRLQAELQDARQQVALLKSEILEQRDVIRQLRDECRRERTDKEWWQGEYQSLKTTTNRAVPRRPSGAQ